MKTWTTTLLSSLTLVLASLAGLAHSEQPGSADRRGPPPEAFSACEYVGEGEQAQLVTPGGDAVSGTCEDHDGTLVLRPDNKQASGTHRGPPPEAYSACEGKSAGDEAQFEDRRGELLTGTCEDDNGTLVLRPDRSQG